MRITVGALVSVFAVALSGCAPTATSPSTPAATAAAPTVNRSAEVRHSEPRFEPLRTLDGRTYPEAHAEIASGFSQGAVVTIENAGHNLFFSHPRVVELIADFFGGKSAETRTLTAPVPSFVPK